MRTLVKSPVRNKSGVILLVILAAALAFRLIFVVWAVGLASPLKGDEADYQFHAANLAAGRGFVDNQGLPAASRPPLLPLALAGLYKVFGTHVELGRLLQVLLGTAVVGLTYLVAARLCSRRIALVAAALTAVNPYLIFMSSYVLSENLYTVLLLVFLVGLAGLASPARGEGGRREGRAVCASHASNADHADDAGQASRAGWPRLAVLGALLGLATLARPTAAGLAALAAAALLVPGAGLGSEPPRGQGATLGSGSLARRAGAAAVLLAGLAVVLAPWAIRNHERMGRWIVLTTHGGITFYQSNNPLVCTEPALRGGVAPREALPGWERISDAASLASDREAWRLGRAFLRENPGMVPGLLAGKFERFWRLRSHVPLSGVKSGWWWNKGSALGKLASDLDVGLVYAAVVMPTFLIGLVVTARDWRRMLGLYAMIAVHLAAALVFYGSLRARSPIEPVMAIFAACGLAWLGVRLSAARQRAGRARDRTSARGD